ncbi:unnamed protein product [Linum trigynum]|uniref:Uncharacterized protein n=1 Tax=Linum trigynum TaxID=586398 RepID=A0AAV2E3K1_9ROSI
MVTATTLSHTLRRRLHSHRQHSRRLRFHNLRQQQSRRPELGRRQPFEIPPARFGVGFFHTNRAFHKARKSALPLCPMVSLQLHLLFPSQPRPEIHPPLLLPGYILSRFQQICRLLLRHRRRGRWVAEILAWRRWELGPGKWDLSLGSGGESTVLG